jgi:hypothetical protein
MSCTTKNGFSLTFKKQSLLSTVLTNGLVCLARRSDNDLPAGFAYGLIVVGVGLVSGFIIVARMYLKLRQRQDYDEI